MEIIGMQTNNNVSKMIGKLLTTMKPFKNIYHYKI